MIVAIPGENSLITVTKKRFYEAQKKLDPAICIKLIMLNLERKKMM